MEKADGVSGILRTIRKSTLFYLCFMWLRGDHLAPLSLL
mgnify:CR=1 FL=1